MSSPLSRTLSRCRDCGAPLSPLSADGYCASCLLDGALQLGLLHSPSPEAPSAEVRARIGVYDLLEEIGRGGMGVVYRARQRSLNRMVAVKMILSGQFAGRHEVLRFRAEAEMAAKLNHPSIVAVHESGEHEGQHYFSMDFVQGHSLAEIVRDGGPLPARRAANYAKTVAEAIQYAHEQGVLHRDLKPSNVLIDGEDRPRITDFGLARHLRNDFGLTVTGQLLGSPNFMSPEQASGSTCGEQVARQVGEADHELASEVARRGKPSPMIDVYGIGAILYHSLTGRPPFQADMVQEVLLQLRETEPVSPRRLNASVPRDLETICLKCLQKEPHRRYHTPKEVADELSRFLDNEPLVARPVSRSERLWRWCRRKPLVAGLLLALQLALALGLAGILWEWHRAVQSELAARQHRYVSDMNLVPQVWKEGNASLARALLQAHIPKTGEIDLRGWEWSYLWTLCHTDDGQDRIPGFDDAITDLARSPDGKVLAAATGHSLTVIELASRRKLVAIKDADTNDLIYRVVWSPLDSKIVATAGRAGVVKFWNLESRTVSIFAQYPTGTDRARLSSIAFSPDGKLLAAASEQSFDDSLAVWDVSLRRKLWATNMVNPPAGAVFTQDGKALITGGGESGNARVWDPGTGTELPAFPRLHTGWIDRVAFSPDGQTAATVANDNRLLLWDFEKRQPKATLAIAGGGSCVAFSPDGRLVAVGGLNGLIRIWDVASSESTAVLRGHLGSVRSLCFAPDGTQLFSSADEHEVRVWNVEPARDRNLLAGQRRSVASLAFSPDSKTLATGSFHRDWTELWDVQSRRWITNLIGSHDAWCAAFSPDGRFLATGSYDCRIRVWNPKSLQLIEVLTNTFGIGSLAFSPDSKVLAAACFNFALPTGSKWHAFWDMASGKQIDCLANAAPNAGVVAFSKDGRFLAIGYTDGWVRLWDWKSGEKAAEVREDSTEVWNVAFTADSALLAWGAGEKVIVYDLAAKRILRKLEGHSGGVFAVAFARGGKTLASGGKDGAIRLWNLATGEIVLTLTEQVAPIYSLAFTPKGDLLASGSQDGEVRLWPSTDPEQIQEAHSRR